MADPGLSDLIFPAAASHNFSHIIADLKRSNLTPANRLRSIRQDAEFVGEVRAAFGRPLVANERCGSWYVRPADKAASAYFKSTDGHTNAWGFSTRRLNLHLLELIGRHDGCIIVDSTRRGKRMPDALSKTIPIWCAVLNMALFPSLPPPPLFTPPNTVSPSEHAQITALLPSFLAALRALNLDPAALRKHLTKPLRPLWVTQDSQLADVDADGGVVFEDFHPVICCTASRRVAGGEMSEGGYIQGAGDDTENWAMGLTPGVFWTHAEELMAVPEGKLVDLIVRLVEMDRESAPPRVEPRQVGPRLFVCPLPFVGDTVPSQCRIALTEDVTGPDTWIKSPTHMEVGLGKHKVASRNLRPALPAICAFVSAFLNAHPEPEAGVLVGCVTGKDLSIGAALAVLCWCFDGDGGYKPVGVPGGFNKDMIRVKLGGIMTAFPEANPNRATLQSVHRFLMDYEK